MSRNPRSIARLAGLLVALFATAHHSPWSAGVATAAEFSAAGDRRLPRAEVIRVRDSEATHTFQADPARVRAMVNRAVTMLTGKDELGPAWRELVATQDVVGLKVLSSLGPISGTRPAVVEAVIGGLLEAGLPPHQIVIWDREIGDLRHAGFFELAARYGVRVEGSAQAGYDEETFYDTPLLGTLIWGDSEFGKKDEGVGRKSYVSRLVSRRLTRVINITPLLTHPVVGVTGNLYGLAMGSVDNTGRFEGEAQRLAQAVPEIYALPALSDHVALCIVDALLCQYQGSQRGRLHYSSVLNEIRVSRDAVALDVLSLAELEHQRELMSVATKKVSREIYDNAALLELGVSDPRRIEVRMIEMD